MCNGIKLCLPKQQSAYLEGQIGIFMHAEYLRLFNKWKAVDVFAVFVECVEIRGVIDL